MHRVRITDICRLTGLSRSTVDRALNGRGKVHPRTAEVVQSAIQTLSRTDGSPPETARAVDVLLRIGVGLATQMKDTFQHIKGPQDRYFDLFQQSEEAVLRDLRKVCADPTRAAVVCVKDTERIRAVLTKARKAGKRIISMVSELDATCCDGFVGVDNREAGETAAYLIAQSLGSGPATVGVAVGDHAFRCHEHREIGFRSTLRALAPRTVVAAEARGEDNADKTYHAIKEMFKTHPGIGAIYNVSGGNEGLARALRELGIEQDICVVIHELTHVSVPLLQDGTANYSLSQEPFALLSGAMEAARAPIGDGSRPIDMGIYSRFNLTRYAREVG